MLWVKRNASTILSCVGVIGVIATAVMAVKATPKAVELLDEAKEEKGEELTKTEVVKVAAPVYIPAVIVGVSTVVCVLSANALNKRQQAAITSAYALLDSSYKNYRTKVVELYGEDAENVIREEIAKDEYENTDITVSEGNQLFYDAFSGRYFESTLFKVQQAEYYINRDLIINNPSKITFNSISFDSNNKLENITTDPNFTLSTQNYKIYFSIFGCTPSLKKLASTQPSSLKQ